MKLTMVGPSAQSPSRGSKRLALAESLADVALTEGVGSLSLRIAADRLGTSDRMLVYYFTSKDGLITATLDAVARRLEKHLSELPHGEKCAPWTFLESIVPNLINPDNRAFMTLWAEIVSRASRGDRPYTEAVARISAFWIGWIIERVEFDSAVSPDRGAAALLSLIEGLTTADMLGIGGIGADAGLPNLRIVLKS